MSGRWKSKQIADVRARPWDAKKGTGPPSPDAGKSCKSRYHTRCVKKGVRCTACVKREWRRSSVLYGYHGTSRRRLASIRRQGLVPSEQVPEHADEQRAADVPAVFFTHSPEGATCWGEAILRFPWPQEAAEDPYGDAILDDPGYTNWYTEEPIAPEDIEVYGEQERAWLPLFRRGSRTRKKTFVKRERRRC